jgi:hypothetical protein
MDIGNDKVIPFGSFSLGATWFSAPDYETQWVFSVTAGLGLKVMFSDRVGVMLRTRLMLPMNFSGGTYYYGVGGGGLSVSSYSSLVQGDFNGGLIIALGN